MSRFARVTEEVLRRHKELAVEHHKTGKVGRSAPDTFYLYLVILCHSWASGYLEMPFADLCRVYDLEYHNSTRRLKILREKGWIEKKGKQIRPLLIHRPTEKASDSKSVTVTSQPKKSVTVTPLIVEKSVTVTPEKCNGYTESKVKSVTVTPENAATHDEISGSADSMIFKDLKNPFMTTTHHEKTAGVSVENGNNFSKFSLPECLAYVEICKRNGDDIRNPRALAITLHQNGSADAFIEAALYPEQSAPEQTVVYDEENHLEELFVPETEPLSDTARESSLVMLRGMLRDTSLDGLQNMAEFYTSDDWAWLMENLEKVER